VSIVAVIDATRAWENAGVEEHRVVVISPDDDVAARLAELAPKRIVVNLASARALDAVMALRAAGVGARLWGCLADPARGRVLPIGMIDVAARPLDPDAVVAALGAYTTRGSRVMTIGDDVDAFVSLRQALARHGLSVSMAWNAKQADELLPMVKPAAVVVDMALPPRDGAGIVAQLSACDPVPATLLIPSGRDQALAFLAALNDTAHAERVLPLERLIARVLAKSEAAPKGEPAAR
jgi:CheY-like chemotaxis protein